MLSVVLCNRRRIYSLNSAGIRMPTCISLSQKEQLDSYKTNFKNASYFLGPGWQVLERAPPPEDELDDAYFAYGGDAEVLIRRARGDETTCFVLGYVGVMKPPVLGYCQYHPTCGAFRPDLTTAHAHTPIDTPWFVMFSRSTTLYNADVAKLLHVCPPYNTTVPNWGGACMQAVPQGT